MSVCSLSYHVTYKENVTHLYVHSACCGSIYTLSSLTVLVRSRYIDRSTVTKSSRRLVVAVIENGDRAAYHTGGQWPRIHRAHCLQGLHLLLPHGQCACHTVSVNLLQI